MNIPPLSLQVRRPDEHSAVVDIVGEVTASAAQPLSDVYDEAAAAGPTAVVLNFTGLEYMNSSGIGTLVTLLVRANRQRRALLAYGLSDHYRQIFELTRLDEAIGISTDEAGALRAARLR